MKFIEEYDKTDIKPCAATIGCFDGVHTGHRYLVKQVRDIADEKGLKSALITFPVHPRQVMQADYMPELLYSYRVLHKKLHLSVLLIPITA